MTQRSLCAMFVACHVITGPTTCPTTAVRAVPCCPRRSAGLHASASVMHSAVHLLPGSGSEERALGHKRLLFTGGFQTPGLPGSEKDVHAIAQGQRAHAGCMTHSTSPPRRKILLVCERWSIFCPEASRPCSVLISVWANTSSVLFDMGSPNG